MKSAIRPIAIITLSLFGFLVILSYYTDKSQFELSAKEMHAKVLAANYMVKPDKIVELAGAQLVDIRDSKSFVVAPREEAINIPLSSILNEENETFFKSDKAKVLVSDDPADAHEAWMLLTQLGYENLYVTETAKAVEEETPEAPKESTGPRKVISAGH